MAQRNAPRMLWKGAKKIQLDMNTIIDRFSPILKVEARSLMIRGLSLMHPAAWHWITSSILS